MAKRTKNFLVIGGVISLVVGLMVGVPSALRGNVGFALGSTFLVVLGLILLALAFD